MSSDQPYAHLKPEDFFRGATPANIEEQCLSLCQAYIGGSWNDVRGEDDFKVTRITGGISNQLYRVELGDSIKKLSGNLIYPEDPRDVTIKLYENKRLINHHVDDPERLNDTIILTLMSQVGLGPKVYGIFENGVIQAYHKHRKVGAQLQKDPIILRETAHTLARVHHLDVPIRKTPNWQIRQTDNMLTSAFKHHPVDKLIEELKLTTLKSHPIRDEFAELQTVITNLKYLLVFCHNDYLGSNVLVTEPDDKILLIDLEYCSYGCRGYDLGVFLSQWGIEPNDYEHLDAPEDEVMERFIKLYIEGCEAIEPGYSVKPENSVKAILYEAKLYTMVFFLFWAAFPMNLQEPILPAIPFDIRANYKLAENYYRKYQLIKQRL